MKRVLNFFVFLIAILALHNFAMAQTGPGGVGNSTGTNGQPRNILWLDANDLGLTDGVNVPSWTDASGNTNDLAQGDANFQPEFYTSQINGYPIVRFIAANNTRLVKANFDPSVEKKAYSIIIVYKTSTATDNTDAMVSYAISTQDNELLIYDNSDLTTYISGNINSSSVSFQNGGNFQIATHKWRSSDGTLRLFQNGTQQYSATFQAGDSITANGTLAIGGDQDALDAGYDVAEAFGGDIAEIIMFSSYINDAQRTIIENYLNIKYGIAISNKVFGNDADYNTSYTSDLTGVGQELDGNQLYATSGNTGFYLQSIGSLDNGDYLMVAHDGSTNAARTPVNVAGTVEARWEKDWYIEQTGEQNAKVTFDFSEGIVGQSPQNISNYVLLYRATTSGDYSIVSTSSLVLTNGDQLAFTVLGANLPSGYYTLGTLDQTNSPLEGASTKTWYSYKSGNWSEWQTWTLDPSGSLLNNPDETYPQSITEKVVIKSGKNVMMDLSSLRFASVTVDGTLDLVQTTGHTFDILKGNGIIRMAADNFPAGDPANFVTKGQGEGTAVYYYSGGPAYNLSTPRTFYNLEIDMDGHTTTLLKNYTINGYLKIKKGTFQINDGSSTTGLNINVYGDVEVSAGDSITTGTANARHQLNLYGNFTNNGVVKFTQRTTAGTTEYQNEANDGIVDANFLHASKNQTINCNGLTYFYRIEIDKGTDKTYELYIGASDATNFYLLGYAHQDHGSYGATVPLNSNALSLINGTVRIGTNVNIPVLNDRGNYNIAEGAQLWVDGGTVTKPTGTAIVPYGTARVSAGTFTASVSSGFTFRDNGLIKVEGGTLNANQIRTSVNGAGNVGGYYQSGGIANIGGSSTSTAYYVFNLTYSNNTFTMSGGTLNILQANAKGGIFINSDPGNYNVTGGTVVFDIDNTNDFVITSKAPFWNVIMSDSVASSKQYILNGGTSGTGTAPDLVT
ncbi:MAG: hypothetical protein P1P88_09825, partial [Bacteroidales bacterium]|nr:hypothetical protein [Bacteroidales bacterium]